MTYNVQQKHAANETIERLRQMKQLSDKKLDCLLNRWADSDCLERDAFLELKEHRALSALSDAATTELRKEEFYKGYRACLKNYYANEWTQEIDDAWDKTKAVSV